MKPFEHQVYHRNIMPRRLPAARVADTGCGSTTHLRGPVAVPIPAHHAQHPTPVAQTHATSRPARDDLEPGEPVQQLDQHQLGPIPVLDVGGMNWPPGGIHYNVALAPSASYEAPFFRGLHRLASMMAALGVASLPSLSRTWPRSASSTRSQVPSARHFYHHTVPQGGRSWGTIRHGMPPCKTYSMPFTTSVHGAPAPPGRCRR